MSQKEKNNNYMLAQRNNNDTIKQVTLPKGSILFQFKEYTKKNRKVSDIITFLSLKNAELLTINPDEIDNKLKKELYEFYDFFMDNYDETTVSARMKNWGQEPLIFRLTEYLMEQDEIQAQKQYLATRDKNVFREAKSLCDTLFAIRKNRLLEFFTGEEFFQIQYPKTIRKSDLDDAKRVLLVHCCIVIEEKGTVIVRTEEDDGTEQIFGIRVLPIGIWSPVSKEEMLKAHTITPTGIELEPEDGTEYVEIMREKF